MSLTEGRCAALVLCGALKEKCGSSNEDWERLVKQFPADLLVFSSVFGAELVAEGDEIVRRMLGSIDVLCTDVDGLLALFDNEGETIARATAASDGEDDRSATVVELLQRMVCTFKMIYILSDEDCLRLSRNDVELVSQDVHFVLAVSSKRAFYVLAHRRIWKVSLGCEPDEQVDCTMLHDEIAAVRFQLLGSLFSLEQFEV